MISIRLDVERLSWLGIAMGAFSITLWFSTDELTMMFVP